MQLILVLHLYELFCQILTLQLINQLSNNTRQFCDYARFANERAKRVSQQTSAQSPNWSVLLLLLYKQESIYFHSLQQIYFFPSEYEKAMMNLRFLFKKTHSLLLNVGYFFSHHQRDIMPCKQERIIVVSCACRTCDTRRVFMRYTAMRYGFEMREKANHR